MHQGIYMKKRSVLVLAICSFSLFAEAKRLAPQPVKSVSNAGLRYEAVQWSIDNPKMKQNGGYVRVVNTRNKLPICTKQVYETNYDQKLESDIQDNFITGLKIEGQNLVVSSEKLAPIKKPLADFCD